VEAEWGWGGYFVGISCASVGGAADALELQHFRRRKPYLAQKEIKEKKRKEKKEEIKQMKMPFISWAENGYCRKSGFGRGKNTKPFPWITLAMFGWGC
jgi:hypothetical protein